VVCPRLATMTLTTEECLAAITAHSAGIAAASRGNLSADVEHCPDWSVGDLVWHLSEVHWFWATIAEERLGAPPDESRRPSRPADDALVDGFQKGAARLVDVLGAADQSATCWTWAPQQQDVAFITRHQVQEAAVHHWDAVHAAGGSLGIEAEVAADSVDEFLTFSVSTEADPAEPPVPSLEATFVLRASDTRDAWTLTDGSLPGTLTVTRVGDDDAPTVTAPASDLLLWLYARVDLDTGLPAGLENRFRALAFTD
jgi:uncharacterized protein (TIGR03083 family)